jgi:hypothetical protein
MNKLNRFEMFSSFDTLTSKRKQKYAGLRTIFDLFRINTGVKANKNPENRKKTKSTKLWLGEEKDKL